jgi:hypothetical protein
MATTAPTTKPCPADRDQPVTPGRSALADVALAFGICPDAVEAYVAHQAAFVSAPYRFVAACVELQAVSA